MTGVYNGETDIKEELIELIEQKNDYQGAEYLKRWIDQYHSEENGPKKNLIKFCIYRLSSELKDEELSSFDCDVCESITKSYLEIYKYLSGFEVREQFVGQQKKSTVKYEITDGNTLYRGDTMTSAWIILKEYVKKKMQIYEIEDNDKWEYFILRNIDEIDISEEMSRFIELCHTEGNFIPVPMGFNAGRSNFGKWDSWDLTLSQICKWYENNSETSGNNEALELLFSSAENKEYSISQCVMWLEKFETWENFISQNYLDSFVNEDKSPLLFFMEHSFENSLPNSIDEFECFVQTVNTCIEQRITLIEKTKANGEQNHCKGGWGDALLGLGYVAICIADIMAVGFSIFVFIKSIIDGAFSEQWQFVKNGKILELADNADSITYLTDSYSSGLPVKLSVIFLLLAVVFIFWGGIGLTKGKVKIGLTAVSIIPLIGLPTLAWISWKYYNYPFTKEGMEWVERVGDEIATQQYYGTLKHYAIIGIILGVIVLIVFNVQLVVLENRKEILREAKWAILSILGVIILIPLILYLVEDFFRILSVILTIALAILIGAFLMKVLEVISDLSAGEDSIKLFDEDGKFWGWGRRDK